MDLGEYERIEKKVPTMKSTASASKAGKSEGAVEEIKSAGDNNGFFTPNEKIDFSNVKIEPLFEEHVDFETSPSPTSVPLR